MGLLEESRVVVRLLSAVSLPLQIWWVSWAGTWLAGPLVLLRVATSLEGTVLTVTMVASLLWTALCHCAAVLIRSVVFVVDRLIDYPPGIVVGVSVILVTLGVTLGLLGW
jgi:hypothetical protein